MLENLSKYHVLLASKSPRRRELLAELRIPFDTVAIGGIDESYPQNLHSADVAQYISEKKGDAYRRIIHSNELIITSDTIVVLGDRVLGKPRDHGEARDMLRLLSGKVHKVITGVTITTKDRRTSFTTETEVKFSDLSEDDINYYVDSFEPLDKAGAYGIQEWIGCVGVEWIRGSFYNVMGLPVHRLYEELRLF